MTERRINISHHVATITISNDQDCWAAATAMVLRRNSNAGTDHVKSLAHSAGIQLDVGTLPESSVRRFAHAVHLNLHSFPRKDVSLERMGELLQKGPVVAFGYFNHPSSLAATPHAVAIYSLIGSGTRRHTRVSLVDPAGPTNPFSDDWDHFITRVADIQYILSH